MTDREEKILQKFTALEGWVKRARDLKVLGTDKDKLNTAWCMVWKCLYECELLDD